MLILIWSTFTAAQTLKPSSSWTQSSLLTHTIWALNASQDSKKKMATLFELFPPNHTAHILWTGLTNSSGPYFISSSLIYSSVTRTPSTFSLPLKLRLSHQADSPLRKHWPWIFQGRGASQNPNNGHLRRYESYSTEIMEWNSQLPAIKPSSQGCQKFYQRWRREVDLIWNLT